jgi:steroid 5-alpha reductase family enzyme
VEANPTEEGMTEPVQQSTEASGWLDTLWPTLMALASIASVVAALAVGVFVAGCVKAVLAAFGMGSP